MKLRRMEYWKKVTILMSLFLLAVIAGCQKQESEAMDSSVGVATPQTNQQEDLQVETSTVDKQALALEDGSSDHQAIADNPEKKWIVTENISAESSDYDTYIALVEETTSQMEGYFEQTDQSKDQYTNSRYSNFSIRIPKLKVEEFVKTIEQGATITYKSKTTQDITLTYIDTQSHIKALRTEESTLLTLLEKAEKLEDVIAIQSQLTQVRYQLESLTSQIKVYDNMVDYAFVYLSVTEVQRESNASEGGFWSQVGKRIEDNAYGILLGLTTFGIFFFGSLPLMLPIILLIFFVLFWIRKKRRNKNKKLQSKEEEK